MTTQTIYRPRLYFSLTFATTFAFWFAGAWLSFQPGSNGRHMLLLLPGLMMPFVISLALLARSKSPELKRDFINRLVNLRLIRPRRLPAFFLLMPAAVLVSILVSFPFGGSASQLRLAEGFSFSSGFVPVLLLLLLAAVFEELGWRSYAFDALASRHNVLVASLFFGVLWSLWHVPLVFVKDSYQYEIFHQSFWFGANFFLGIVPMGVIISWICAKNGKSILAAILFHFLINLSQEALDITQTTKCIETAVLILIAGGLVIRDRELFFSRPQAAPAR